MQVPKVAELLKDAGEEVFVTGGAVLATLSGEEPDDVDLATSATPDVVERIARDAGLVVWTAGRHREHGTVGVMDPVAGKVELTTFRIDGPMSDGRRPDSVTFTRSRYEDQARRDLTIGSMMLDLWSGDLHDPFEGRKDFEARIIRAVRDPKERFMEDALRVLRAARFAAKFAFRIESDTYVAMADADVRAKFFEVDPLRGTPRVGWERRGVEVLKAMRGKEPERFFVHLEDRGLLDVVFPEMVPLVGMTQNEHHAYDAWEHSVRTLEDGKHRTRDPVVRLAMGLHDAGKGVTRAVKDGRVTFYEHEHEGAKLAGIMLRRFGLDNDLTERVQRLVENHMLSYDNAWSDGAVRRLVTRVGVADLHELAALRKADIVAHGKPASQDARLESVDALMARAVALDARGKLVLPKPPVSGADLMAEPYLVQPGKEFGVLLKQLQDMWVENPNLTREDLLGRVPIPGLCNAALVGYHGWVLCREPAGHGKALGNDGHYHKCRPGGGAYSW